MILGSGERHYLWHATYVIGLLIGLVGMYMIYETADVAWSAPTIENKIAVLWTPVTVFLVGLLLTAFARAIELLTDIRAELRKTSST
jgi:uncharacterized membrane protein